MTRLEITLPAEDRLVLLPKNPGSFFALWHFSSARQEAFRSGALAPEVELRLVSEDKVSASSCRAAWDAAGAYLDVPAQGRAYTASLYARRGEEWEKLLESNPAGSPAPAGLASDRAYASLEFHKRVQP
jgi:hypothetical protein